MIRLDHMIFSKQFFFLENNGFLLAALSCHTMVAQCSPDGGLMNINISQCEKAFSCLEVTLGTVATSQTITQSALE